MISKPPKLEQKKRVAAYARVSSGKDAMLHSLSAQVSYYSKFIQSRPEWIYAGVYVDEAKTGTKVDREGFQRLIADCRAGKVDMILTKSISRFARNTVSLLEIARECKALGVDIYFEEQNIHTISGDGELMMTILASYAQEESLSASDNQKWRIRKNFEEGKPWSGTIHGYRYENGKYVVVPEEAALVQKIFQWYLEGLGYNAIAQRLNAEGFRTRNDKLWYQSTIMAILRNAAFTGDLLLQKTYRENHMTKRKRLNQGEHPMFRVEEAHEAIICKETFDAVQREMSRRACRFKKPATDKPEHPFNGKLVCGVCGGSYHRKDVHGGPVWTCGRFNRFGKSACASKRVPEDTLMSATATALGQDAFDEPAFRDRVDRIQVCNENTLIFRFKDGTEATVIWKDKSRSQNWTDEMREAARQRTCERNKQQCQK
jgi:DNA invertase Pin-like site-specific DNA recombinase